MALDHSFLVYPQVHRRTLSLVPHRCACHPTSRYCVPDHSRRGSPIVCDMRRPGPAATLRLEDATPGGGGWGPPYAA